MSQKNRVDFLTGFGVLNWVASLGFLLWVGADKVVYVGLSGGDGFGLFF